MSILDHIAMENTESQIEETGLDNQNDSELNAKIAEYDGDIVETESNIDSISKDYEDAEEKIRHQQELIGDVADTLEDGGEGLPVESVDMVERATERFANHFRLPYERIFPAKEAYGSSTGSRRQATQIAMEGMTEVVKKAVERLKAVGKILTDLFRKLVSLIKGKFETEKLKIENLKVKVRNLPNDTNFEEKNYPSELVTAFSLDGKAGAESVKKYLQFTLKSLDIHSNFSKYFKQEFEATKAELIKGDKKIGEAEVAFLKKIVDKLNENVIYIGNKNFKNTGTSISLQDNENSKKAETIEPPTKSDLEEILDKSYEIIKSGIYISKKKTFAEEIADFYKSFSEDIEKFSGLAENHEGVNVQLDFQSFINWAANIEKISGESISEILSSANTAVKCAIYYVEQSIK